MPNFQELQSDNNFDAVVQHHMFNNSYFPIADSTAVVETSSREITETFLQSSSVEILPQIHFDGQMDWVIYLLLFFLAGVAITAYYLPEKLVSIFTFSEEQGPLYAKESSITNPGLLIRVFFLLNYFVTVVIFVYLFIVQLIPAISIKIDGYDLMLYIGTSILLLFIFRLLLVMVTGFIFNTWSLASKQLNLHMNTDNSLGILLIPILLLILFVKADAFLYIGLIVVLIAHIFRWLQTFFLGKTVSGYSLLHLFMYLCTLEIIPLLVLIKLLQQA